MEEKEKAQMEKMPACIPFFAHENTMVHMSASNHRMFVTVVCVCVTFILTIIIFTSAFTAREKAWLDTLSQIRRQTSVEVQDGIHQYPDQMRALILEHLHSARDREILQRRLIDGITFEALAEEFDLSERRVNMLYHALKSAETYYAMKEAGDDMEDYSERGGGMRRNSYRRGDGYGSYARGRSPRTGRYISRDMGYSGRYPMEYMDGGWDGMMY